MESKQITVPVLTSSAVGSSYYALIPAIGSRQYCNDYVCNEKTSFHNRCKVRMEAPEIFRILGKRRPEFVRSYLEQLQQIAEADNNRVVRIHCLGAIKATALNRKTALEAGMNGHLAKPYDIGAIMQTLSNLLK